MKNLRFVTIALVLGFAGLARAGNDNIVNPASSPVRVRIYPDPSASASPQPVAVTSVTATVVRGAPTDRSGTITTGGTSQTLAAALSTRTYIEIQNISDETMYVNFGAAATTDSNSFKIVAGGSYVNPSHYCPTGSITIIGATTGKKFVAKEG